MLNRRNTLAEGVATCTEKKVPHGCSWVPTLSERRCVNGEPSR
jgi:hypothetical protein